MIHQTFIFGHKQEMSWVWQLQVHWGKLQSQKVQVMYKNCLSHRKFRIRPRLNWAVYGPVYKNIKEKIRVNTLQLQNQLFSYPISKLKVYSMATRYFYVR
jgi:hypothetical protein